MELEKKNSKKLTPTTLSHTIKAKADVAEKENQASVSYVTGQITEVVGDNTADSMIYMACSICYSKILNTTWSLTGGYKCAKCNKTVQECFVYFFRIIM